MVAMALPAEFVTVLVVIAVEEAPAPEAEPVPEPPTATPVAEPPGPYAVPEAVKADVAT